MDEGRMIAIDWAEFHWLRPEWLWGLIPAAVVFLILFVVRRKEERWTKRIAEHLRPFVLRTGNHWAMRWPRFLLLLGLVVMVLAIAGPTWDKQEKPGRVTETALFVLLDVSQSMLVDDLQPNRLERAKFKIKDLIKANPGARMSLVAYAGSAHSVVPLTNDYDNLLVFLDDLHPKIMPIAGSDLEQALLSTDSLLARIEAPSTRLIFTDDVSTTNNQLLAQYDGEDQFLVVPMATPAGGAVPRPGSTRPLMVNGNRLDSRLDVALTEQLASLPNTSVINLTLDDSDMGLVAAQTRKNLEFQESPDKLEELWVDAGYFITIAVAVFVLFWFRRGWIVVGASCWLLIATSCDVPTRDWFYTADYQGQQLYDREEYLAAAEAFKDPVRKGNAYYRAGEYAAALMEFEKDTTAASSYNKGLTLMKMGRFQSAAMALAEAAAKNEQFDGVNNDFQAWLSSQQDVRPEEIPDSAPPEGEQMENRSPEDLSGGGQEATEEQMQQERLAEEAATEMRTAEELDELPPDFDMSAGERQDAKNILLRKTSDEPGEFLRRKFRYQARKHGLKARNPEVTW